MNDFNRRTDRHRRLMSEEPQLSFLESVVLLAIVCLGTGRFVEVVKSWLWW